MVPEALRMVQKPVMQATSKVVQKQEKRKGEEEKCCQKAEKVFLVLESINFNRGANTMFPPKRE